MDRPSDTGTHQAPGGISNSVQSIFAPTETASPLQVWGLHYCTLPGMHVCMAGAA
ncbi:hypothetical protein CHLRE_23g754597v5 [Chlamydomonas reinhardtii]|uniref:Uncharacterized protein n=1 Tax=Chlamydomonas reinhardtii TaxID=3055 RepID=A0A2K3CN64_CHLRE|nr:uncharacterized protein CHLRE_23g754597v5 [Chlamydomonas reinhardtii]PNW69713.1 hypothetical protein CHLRE_23g754597v5 [Chlamydomonas reinhardtii]